MKKRIIFDLDDTLIEWKDEYWKSVGKALNKCKIKYTDKDIENVKLSVDNYEAEYNTYKKEYMLECINKYSRLNLNIKFMDYFLEELSNCVPEKLDNTISETLEYLQRKYELVVLTNWFKSSQVKRLEKCNIRKYFKEIYASDEFLNKPNKEAFIIASNNNVRECVMIGDNINSDIKGAINVGMEAIYVCKEINEKNNNYITINNLKEIINIL